MAVIQCPDCEATVPEARLCINCGIPRSDTGIPPEVAYLDDLTERLSERAIAASHDSVSFDTLRSTHDKYDRPLGGYLLLEEQPEAVFQLNKTMVEGYSESSWTVKSGMMNSGHLIVSTDRLLSVTPGGEVAQALPVHIRDVVSVSTRSTWRDSVLSIDLADGTTYSYYLGGMSDDDLESVQALVERVSRNQNSAESWAAQFVQDADDAIAESETAESALRAVADLFAERDETTVFDHSVAEAESVQELFTALSNSTAIASPATENQMESDADVSLPVRRPRLSSLRRQVAYTAQNADPAEVGKYALGAGIMLGTYAVSAPISTPLGLAAIAAGGAATGAYASTHPGSLAAQIDPIPLAISAKAAGRQWKKNPAPGGTGVGMALGAIDHLEEDVVPPEYAHWVANADYDAIMRGAEMARRAAESSQGSTHPEHAAALGGGFGLLYGYLDDETRADLEGLLDKDLYEALQPPEEEIDVDPVE
jgi:hypothetical protein